MQICMMLQRGVYVSQKPGTTEKDAVPVMLKPAVEANKFPAACSRSPTLCLSSVVAAAASFQPQKAECRLWRFSEGTSVASLSCNILL